jgi:UDP-N-acetylmuramoylalanine--D-glutamate ligase
MTARTHRQERRDRHAAKRAVIVGLGRTGLSCARFLHARGVPLAITDSRATPPELRNLGTLAQRVELRLGAFDAGLLDGASQIVVSPGVSLREPLVQEAVARGIEVLGDIELFAREANAPVVAITGTNGKSTVTTLVAQMAQRAGRRVRAGGNLGEPALELLETPPPDCYVLELSSFQLETTSTLRSVAATVLNVTADHMDRYSTLDEYATAKARIFERCTHAVINLDDEIVRAMPLSGQHVIGFSIEPGRRCDYGIVPDANGRPSLAHGATPLLALADMKLTGMHNAANALAALALGEAAGLPRVPMLAVLREFVGLPHRMQWVADRRGVRWINDSKGTNVGATLAAVGGMQGPLVLIAGGDGKNQDFSPLRTAFRGKVRHVVLIGRDAAQVEAAIAGVCTTEHAATMVAAVNAAAAAAQSGETVLLSPACASLDMFRDYTHRGAVFADAVRGLAP